MTKIAKVKLFFSLSRLAPTPKADQAPMFVPYCTTLAKLASIRTSMKKLGRKSPEWIRKCPNFLQWNHELKSFRTSLEKLRQGLWESLSETKEAKTPSRRAQKKRWNKSSENHQMNMKKVLKLKVRIKNPSKSACQVEMKPLKFIRVNMTRYKKCWIWS